MLVSLHHTEVSHRDTPQHGCQGFFSSGCTDPEASFAQSVLLLSGLLPLTSARAARSAATGTGQRHKHTQGCGHSEHQIQFSPEEFNHLLLSLLPRELPYSLNMVSPVGCMENMQTLTEFRPKMCDFPLCILHIPPKSSVIAQQRMASDTAAHMLELS